MPEQQSKRVEAEDTSHVDHLLSLLADLSRCDPPPVLRERLSALAVQRLRKNSESAGQFRDTGHGLKVWLKPALAAALLIAIGIATVSVFHFRQQAPAQIDRTLKKNHPVASPEYKAYVASAAQPVVSRRPRIHHLQSDVSPPIGARQMTMRLPYSNNAINTGTNTTIRVSMAQSELVSLGFPINTAVQDRRVVADLTLGDDGLPRAISVPLPLEVMKEKK